MKRFGMRWSGLFAGIAVFAAACSSSDPIEPGRSVAANLTIRVTDPPPSNNGFESPRDIVNVGASVSDDRGKRFDGGSVDWSLKLVDGQPAADSIGAITSTGPRTARIIFRKDGLVGINASLAGSDGAMVSKTLYIVSGR